MRKNVIFETRRGNRYLYTESTQYYILLHPLLEKEIESKKVFNDQNFDIDDQEYYKQKYLFLLTHGVLQHVEVNFITKQDPKDLKIKLANLRQLLFEVTDGCNLKCRYCGYGELYNNYDIRQSSKLSFEKVKQVVDYMTDLWSSTFNLSFNNVIDISFYGGEPLLNMNLIKKTITYLDEKKISGLTFSYRMTTNATLLDCYMDYLVEKKFRLLISLDGEEHSNSYRETKSGKNSFSHIYNNALLLKKKYPDYFAENVEFNAVLHDRNTYEGVYWFIKNNFDKTPLISELSDTGVKSDKLMEFNSMFKNINEAQKDFYANGNELSDNDLFTKTDNVFFRSLLHGFTGNKYNSLNDLLKKKESVFYMPSGTCLAFYKKIFLTVNGKVLPCEKIGQKHPLGYVDDNKVDIDLDNISALYDKMYVPLLKLCKECYRQGNCSQCVFHI